MKMARILFILSMTVLLGGCGKAAEIGVGAGGSTEISTEAMESMSVEFSEESTESETAQENETPDLRGLTADELLDLFIEGEISATYPDGERDSFYITDLPIDVQDDWYSYSIGERVDLDNDGEVELILEGPYGGMYLDTGEGEVRVLAFGDGTAATLGYTVFDNQTWIVHSDVTHGGREIYDFTLYEGAGNVVDEFRLSREYWEHPQEPDGLGTVYTYRDKEITKAEYEKLLEKMLGVPAKENAADNASSGNQGAFFPEGTHTVAYKGSLWPVWDFDEEETKVELLVSKIQSFAEGDLYHMEIQCEEELKDVWGVDRADLGVFLVMEDQIYRVGEAQDVNYTVENIVSAGTLVCSGEDKADVLGEQEKGWHEYIVTKNGRSEYHAYNNLVETGYYECFIWETGKGLVHYRSGYGAAEDAIELNLAE